MTYITNCGHAGQIGLGRSVAGQPAKAAADLSVWLEIVALAAQSGHTVMLLLPSRSRQEGGPEWGLSFIRVCLQQLLDQGHKLPANMRLYATEDYSKFYCVLEQDGRVELQPGAVEWDEPPQKVSVLSATSPSA
jgi:hypothetical protein